MNEKRKAPLTLFMTTMKGSLVLYKMLKIKHQDIISKSPKALAYLV